MNYLDIYFSRVNHLGETTAERIRGAGIRSFVKWLAESPHTVRGLSVERGLYFDGIILTSKDKEYEKIMFLEVALDIPIKVGDIMNWKLDDGSVEKWLLLQEEKKTNGTFRSFWIVRCNYLLKWIDGNGHLQQSWAYFVSSVDSKIKGNYRTWNNLITPQPNKYAEVVMPRYPINRSTNFIVEEESWTVVEYDHTSVPGTIYLSLTEGKINSIYDDVDNNIADLDKLAKYDFIFPESTQVFKVDDLIQLDFTLMKNGVPSSAPVDLATTNKKIAKVQKYSYIDSESGKEIIVDRLIAVSAGTVDIIVKLQSDPTIQKTVTITIGDEEEEFAAYIDGKEKVRLASKATYSLKGTSAITGVVTFTINDEQFAKVIETADNECTIETNSKNLLGDVILTATYQDKEYTKKISIIPLW